MGWTGWTSGHAWAVGDLDLGGWDERFAFAPWVRAGRTAPWSAKSSRARCSLELRVGRRRRRVRTRLLGPREDDRRRRWGVGDGSASPFNDQTSGRSLHRSGARRSQKIQQARGTSPRTSPRRGGHEQPGRGTPVHRGSHRICECQPNPLRARGRSPSQGPSARLTPHFLLFKVVPLSSEGLIPPPPALTTIAGPEPADADAVAVPDDERQHHHPHRRDGREDRRPGEVRARPGDAGGRCRGRERSHNKRTRQARAIEGHTHTIGRRKNTRLAM